MKIKVKKIILSIDGMTCSACSNGLEKYLNKQNGIIEASVNLVMANATIIYDENIVERTKLDDFVKQAGFKSLGEFKEINIESRGKKEKNHFIIFTILAIILMYISMGHMINLPIFDIIDVNTNPINSLNPDGSLDIQPKGYFFYKVKATDKLATGNKFNLQIKTKSVAEQTRFEYAFIGADNKYISKNLMIPKVEDGLYQLNNILVPIGTNAIMLRLDNRNGNSDVAIQNISLIAHEALTNEASRNNLIVVPPSQQHIANFAKSIKDSYFSSYQAKNSSPNNSFDKDGSLTIAPSGYFFYNLNTINDLAPGKQFKIQVITAHNADKSKVEYRFTKGENNEKLPIISVQKDAQGNFVSDNITVPENAKTLALRIDNRQGSEEFKILGVNVFPVQV